MLVFDSAKKHARLLQSLILLFTYSICQSSCLSTYDDDKDITYNSTISFRGTLGRYCSKYINCSEDQYCDEKSICRCKPMFKPFGGQCISCPGENDNCTAETCCPFLFCIGGKCRNSESTVGFIALTKISLEIIFAVILSACFVLLIKNLLNSTCLRFGDHEPETETRGNPTVQTYAGQLARRSSFDIRQDKPPSYEECFHSSSRDLLPDSPPPYTISVNYPMGINRNEANLNFINLTGQNLTILNVQSFGLDRDLASDSSERNKSPSPNKS